MPRVIDADYKQVLLLPPCLEDWVGLESPARFIREFVESIAVQELDMRPDTDESLEGRPRYSEQLLLRVWLYAYFCRLRSTRKVEEACRQRMDFIWLSGNLQPDHLTLWRFWDQHKKTIRHLFRQTVKVAGKMNLVGLVLQAIDGTKIQAACSGRQVWDEKALKDQLAALEAQLGPALAAWEAEIESSATEAPPAAQLPLELQQKQELKGKIAAALAQVEAGETRYCHPLEPEARRMGCDGRNRFGYNAQAVVDREAQIIVGAEVVTAEADNQQLGRMLSSAEATAGAKAQQTVADGGYCTGAQLAAAQRAGYEVLSPIPGEPKTSEAGTYHVSRFIYDEAKDVMICPRQQELPFRRVRGANAVVRREYRGVASVCRACPAFGSCTKDRHGRTVERWPWSPIMTAHRTKMASAAAIETYAQRCRIIEPVFGWIKENGSFRRWTVRGLTKVKAQWLWICAASNLRRLYRFWQENGAQAVAAA
jgi:transposase